MPLPVPAASRAATSVLNRAAAHGSTSALHGAARGMSASGLVPNTPSARTKDKAQKTAQLEDQPGIVVKGLDATNSMGSKFFMFDFGSMALGAMLGAVASGLGTLGGWTGFKGIENAGGWFKRRADAVNAPRQFMEATKLEEGLSKTTETLHGKAGKWFGEESAVAKGMGDLAAKAAEAEPALNRNVGMVFGKATSSAGNVLRRVDAPMRAFGGLRQKWATQRLEKLKASMNDAKAAFEKHAGSLGQNAYSNGNPVEKPSLHVMEEGLEGVARTASGHVDNIRGKLGELHTLLHDMPEAAHSPEAHKLLAEIRGDLGGVFAIHHGDKELTSALKELSAPLKSAEKSLVKMGKHAQSGGFWKDVPGALEKLPESVGKMDLHQSAFAGAIMAGTAAEVGHTAFHVKHDFGVLKRMAAAVEGKPVSTLHVLTGHLPPVVAEARSHFFHRYGPETIAETVAAGFNIPLMKKNGGGMMAMAGLMAAPMLGQVMADKNPSIQMYDAMEKMQKAGQPLNQGMYAEFIASAYKKAEDLGADNRLVLALANEYTEAKATPQDVLKDIASGAIDQKAAVVQAKLEKQAEQAMQSPAASADDFKPVLGKHTQKVVETRQGVEAKAPEQVAKADNATEAQEKPSPVVAQVAQAGRLKGHEAALAGGGA